MVLGILVVCIPGLMVLQTAEPPPQSSIALTASSTASIESPTDTTAADTVTYEVRRLPQSLIHILHIPAEARFRVTPALAPEMDTLANFAATTGAIAAVNGGFFDPVNHKTTSYVTLNGAIVADPAQNERLVTNPEMIPNLDRILNRSEFRQYQCGQAIRYAIAAHNDSAPEGCQLQTALGAGPRLLPELTSTAEGFVEIVDGEIVRDAIGSAQPNARTAVGITVRGDVVLAMAAQLPEAPLDSGLSLQELADFMKTLEVVDAMNLDGGSSASLYYQDQTYYGRVDEVGNPVQRPVKSVLVVQDLQES